MDPFDDDLPELMDFDFERNWVASVVEGYVDQARRAAVAARMVTDHMTGWSTSGDHHLAAKYARMHAAAADAEYNADQARALFPRLLEVENHDESSSICNELVMRAAHAGLHLSTVIALAKLPDEDHHSKDES